jgi:hypothetical protein
MKRKLWKSKTGTQDSSPPAVINFTYSFGGAVAQLGARLDGIEEVVGSNPIGSTIAKNSNHVPHPHLRDCSAALAADHGSREQLCGEVFLPTPLLGGESTLSDSARPAPAHVFAARADLFPQLLWHDAQGLVLLNDPLGCRLRKASPSTRPRITPLLRLVPYPVADVFLVVEHAAHSGGGPTLARPDPCGHVLVVQ